MADSDQAIRDIVAQLVSNGQPAPAAAPAQAPYAAPEVTPTMLQGTAAAPAPTVVPGPGGPLVITPPTAAAPASVSAVGPTSVGGAPLSGTAAQWAADPPAADPHSWFNGGLGPSAQPSPPGLANKLYSYFHGKDAPKDAGEDWTAPAPTMVAPAVTPLGAMASVQRPAAPAMGMVLGVPVRR